MKAGKINIAIVDPVGMMAGMDYYDRKLAASLFGKNSNCSIYSNFSENKNEIRAFPFKVQRGFFFKVFIPFRFNQVVKKLVDEKTDIVIYHLFHANKIDHWFLKRLVEKGIKLHLILHDVDSHLKKGDEVSMLEQCLDIASKIYVHSNYSIRELNTKFGAKYEQKTIFAPHGNFLDLPSAVNRTEARQKLKLEEDAFYVLFFGMIKPTKGLDILLEAMKGLTCKLIVAGRPRRSSLNDVQSTLNAIGQEGRLYSMIRYISNDERDLLFKAADVIVLPYKRIYQSGVLLMAMSYGLPVIVSDLEAFREVVNDGENALMFKSENVKDLSAKITAVMNDYPQAMQRAERAKAQITVRNDWQLIGNAILKEISL